MRLASDSLVVRIGAAFLIGAVVFQLALMAVVFWPGGPGRPIFSLISPTQAMAMAQALEDAPPDLRPTIVRALNSDAVVVHLEAGFPTDDPAAPSRAAPRLERLFSRYAEDLGGRPFRIQVRSGAKVGGSPEQGVDAAGPVRLAVSLRTGEVMIVERTRAPVVRRFLDRAMVIGAVGVAILGLVLLACLGQTAGPISALAGSARTFARDLATPDLPLRGAREIKDLSAAFNEMKQTIRALIEDRTRVLAAIAHDLRTYLTRLRLRAEFIDDPDQRQRAVADLDEMSLLLDDTLTFAREVDAAGAPRHQTVDVAAEITDLVATREEMRQNVTTTPMTAEALIATCAPLALRRMLANLVDNAVRYGGGAMLSAGRQGDQIWVAVEDDGPGVPQDALARLTAPFERLEGSRGRQTGGAGLGLAIVQALADSQGGQLAVENRPQGGLRAALRLPVAKRS